MIIDERNSYSKKTILDNECEVQLIELKHAIDSRNIEKSISIGVELHCSGKFKELWNIMISYILKHIHIIDDKLIKKLYIKRARYQDAKKQIHQKIALRNVNILRKDLIELLGYISLLPKRDIYQYIPTHYYYHEYNQNSSLMSYGKLSDTDKYYVQEVINNSNVKEGMMNAIKEIEYQIRIINESENIDIKDSMDKLFYWIGFILSYTPGNNDYQQFLNNDISEVKKLSKNKYIWIVWNILIKYSKETEYYKTICYLYQMFNEKTDENTHLYLVIACMTFYLQLKLSKEKRKKITMQVQEYLLKADELYDNIQKYIDTKKEEKKQKIEEREKRKKERDRKKKEKQLLKEHQENLKKQKGGDHLFQGIIGILPSQDDTYEFRMRKQQYKDALKNRMQQEAKIRSFVDEETGEKVIPVKMKYLKKNKRKKVNIEKTID